jgi:Fe-S-cluster containining protein
MAGGFSPAEEKLYFKTVADVRRALRGARTGGELLTAIRRGFAAFERAFESAPAAARATVACRAGCGTCCHNEVAVQAHEVLIVAEHLQKTLAPAELETLIARTAAQRAEYVANRDDQSWLRPQNPCVLLHEGSCSIYEARPEICRAYHSNNLAGCEHNLRARYEEIDVKVEGLRGRMFAVMLGTDAAIEELGFDDRAYDFGSALHDALTDPLCAVRWAARQPAFADELCERGD